jgi:hypothetical protein
MSEALSTAILSHLTNLATELMVWSREHRDATLADQEQAVLEAVRGMLPKLLEMVLRDCTSAVRLPLSRWRQQCPSCGKLGGLHQWRERQVATRCGSIRFERPYYYCGACKCGWAPADASLGLPQYQRFSIGLKEWLVHLGASTDFREAAELLEKLTGLKVAPETVRQHTEGVGAALEREQQAAMAQVEASQESAVPVEPAPGLLVVETDGVMVRYKNGWHEVKLGLVGGHKDGRTGALSYVAARESAEQFGPRLLCEAARRGALEIVGWQGPTLGMGLAMLREVVILGDGAHWIWTLAADYFGVRTEIVDFYHASEHLWTIAKAQYGQGSDEAKQWAEARVNELYEKGAEPVLAALSLVHPNTKETAEVLRRERGYFHSNAARMSYPQFREQGLPIGSGAIESAAKHLVQLRMKRPGLRWSDTGAQRVLAVRVHLASARPLLSTTLAA